MKNRCRTAKTYKIIKSTSVFFKKKNDKNKIIWAKFFFLLHDFKIFSSKSKTAHSKVVYTLGVSKHSVLEGIKKIFPHKFYLKKMTAFIRFITF